MNLTFGAYQHRLLNIKGIKEVKLWQKENMERIYITLDEQNYDTQIFVDMGKRKLSAKGVKRTDIKIKEIIKEIKLATYSS
jgi:hypothetical protein